MGETKTSLGGYMRFFTLFTIILFFCSQFFAAESSQKFKIFSVPQDEFISYDQMIYELVDSDMIVLGENHDNEQHHLSQKNIIDSISLGSPVSVGLEFVSWMHQGPFNKYQSEEITEEEFLEIVQWGDSFPFDWYRPFVETAVESGGHAFGINAPRWLTSKIARKGIDSLTEEEKGLLPPNFELGSDLYFERFKETMSGMGHPMPPAMIKTLFQAQSTWDETMAYRALENYHVQDHPFFIIVGNFHAKYKLGLPARIEKRAHGNLKLSVVAHVDSSFYSEEELSELIKPDPKYGPLGDYIIFTNN